MGSTRALFASIGVSVSLVAAAALSLFAVSVVIAFGGWSAGMGSATTPATLVFDGVSEAPGEVRTIASEPVILRAPAQPRARRSTPARERATTRPAPNAVAKVGSRKTVVSRAPAYAPPADPPPYTPPAPAPKTGDGVRRLGDDLSSTAQQTGDALGEITAPLGPPVSQAVQQVLDLVAITLQRTTGGVGGTLDKLGRR